jgi:hypothetical protein
MSSNPENPRSAHLNRISLFVCHNARRTAVGANLSLLADLNGDVRLERSMEHTATRVPERVGKGCFPGMRTPLGPSTDLQPPTTDRQPTAEPVPPSRRRPPSADRPPIGAPTVRVCVASVWHRERPRCLDRSRRSRAGRFSLNRNMP